MASSDNVTSRTSSVQPRHARTSPPFRRHLFRQASEIFFEKNHKLHWKFLPNAGILMLYLSVKISNDPSKLRFPFPKFNFRNN